MLTLRQKTAKRDAEEAEAAVLRAEDELADAERHVPLCRRTLAEARRLSSLRRATLKRTLEH